MREEKTFMLMAVLVKMKAEPSWYELHGNLCGTPVDKQATNTLKPLELCLHATQT